MKRKSLLFLFVIGLAAILALTACSNDDDSSGDGGSSGSSDSGSSDSGSSDSSDSDDSNDSGGDSGAYSMDDFSPTKTNRGEPIEGGEITVAIGAETPFEGTLNPLFYSMAIDSSIFGWFHESILEMDDAFAYTQDGAATFELDDDNLVWTISIRDNVNWHDGEPVTAHDMEFSYYVLGDPEYQGTRYTAMVQNVEGMEEYKNGEADSISGIEVLDDKTIQITLLEANPFMLIWDLPIPKHVFGDMEINEMAESPETREHPIGFGPFKVDHIVAGESVVLTKNEDYWRGEVGLDQVTLKVVNSASMIQEIKTGGVDIAGMPVAQYPDNDDLTNVEILADAGAVTTFIGFRLGTVDPDTGEVQPDPNAKMADVELRKAMWHALDTQLVADNYYHGLMQRGSTLIPPYHRNFHDDSNPGLEYDPDKANEILDAAGYEWAEGEDFRTDPNGDELEIIFASYQGGDTAEPIVEFYRQSWGEVGLNVQLLDGRLQEFNHFYDLLYDEGEAEYDIYQAQIVVGSNPDPGNHRGPTSYLNFSRWQSDETNELIAKGRSPEAFDTEWLTEVYNEWQQVMVDNVPEFPTVTSVSLMAINDRIVNYTLDPAEKIYRYQLGVTQETPIIDGQ